MSRAHLKAENMIKQHSEVNWKTLEDQLIRARYIVRNSVSNSYEGGDYGHIRERVLDRAEDLLREAGRL